METEQGALLSEKVSSTASENRKSSKPIMEKRRRARINASLAELKSLLLEVIKKEGSRQNKMEKADILEITVKHLRQLQKQQFSALAASDPSMINKYRLGFNECASEVGKFLGSMEGVDAEARAKLLGHLANCMVTSETTSSVNKCTSKSHVRIDDDFYEGGARKSTELQTDSINIDYSPPQSKCVKMNYNPPQTKSVNLSYSPPNTLSQTCNRNGIIEPMMTMPPQEHIVTSTVSSAVLSHGNVPVQNIIAAQQIPTNQLQIQPNVIQQTTQNFQLPKLVSGVQVIPTKMTTGEMAFIIPANFLSSSQTPNYVIPVLPSQNLTTTHAQFPTATMAPLTFVQPTVAKGEVSINKLSTNSSPSHLSELQPIASICQTNNSMAEHGSSCSNISQRNFDENKFDSSTVMPRAGTMQSQDSLNDRNSNLAFEPKDDSMWRPW